MDLNSEKQKFSDLYSNTRKNEHKNRTKKFYDVRGSSRDDLGTEPLRFDFSTKDCTYEVSYAATRQSHSTVRNNYVSNSLVYFCQLCTMDTLGAVTNLRNCPIFDVCPYCALRHPYGGKGILRSPHWKIFCESGIGNHDTIPIQYEKMF